MKFYPAEHNWTRRCGTLGIRVALWLAFYPPTGENQTRAGFNSISTYVQLFHRFLPGFAPFVDGTVIANPVTPIAPLSVPAGSAVAG